MKLSPGQRDLLNRLRTLPNAELWMRKVGSTWIDASLYWEGMPIQMSPEEDDAGYVSLKDALKLLRAGMLERPAFGTYERMFYQETIYYERCKATQHESVAAPERVTR